MGFGNWDFQIVSGARNRLDNSYKFYNYYHYILTAINYFSQIQSAAYNLNSNIINRSYGISRTISGADGAYRELVFGD